MGCAAAQIISRTSAKFSSRHFSSCKLQKREISSTGFGVASPVLELMQRGDTQVEPGAWVSPRCMSSMTGEATPKPMLDIARFCDKCVSNQCTILKV